MYYRRELLVFLCKVLTVQLVLFKDKIRLQEYNRKESKFSWISEFRNRAGIFLYKMYGTIIGWTLTPPSTSTCASVGASSSPMCKSNISKMSAIFWNQVLLSPTSAITKCYYTMKQNRSMALCKDWTEVIYICRSVSPPLITLPTIIINDLLEIVLFRTLAAVS